MIMGKLNFIQNNVQRLDQLYMIGSQSTTLREDRGSYSPNHLPGESPEVTPMTQAEILEDGTVVHKLFKPLSFSLMSWVKTHMKLNDTIDISDDELEAQFSLSAMSEDGYEYQCYFNTDESLGLISFYIYDVNLEISSNNLDEIKNFIIESNDKPSPGRIQLKPKEDGTFYIRYYAAVSLRNIASEDPKYVGNYQIHPNIFANLYEDGLFWMDKFSTEIRDFC